MANDTIGPRRGDLIVIRGNLGEGLAFVEDVDDDGTVFASTLSASSRGSGREHAAKVTSDRILTVIRGHLTPAGQDVEKMAAQYASTR